MLYIILRVKMKHSQEHSFTVKHNRLRFMSRWLSFPQTISDDGGVWGCGWNKYGQLALPGEESVNHMTKLPVTSSEGKVRDLLCGPWNTCLIMDLSTL